MIQSPEYSKTGGAKIGMASATWPLVVLTVNRECLKINGTFIGNLVFAPSDIRSIEPLTGFGKKGIKINHNVSTYKEEVTFLTSSNPHTLIKEIENTGFLSNLTPISFVLKQEIENYQTQGSSPFKTIPVIAIIVIANILMLTSIIPLMTRQDEKVDFGLGIPLGLVFIALISLLLITVEPARRIILKNGRTRNDIARGAVFLLAISGLMSLAFFFIGKN